MAHDLTPTQSRVLDYIATHIVQRQRPPTRIGIAQHFGWASGNAAEEHMRALVAKVYIDLDPADCNGGIGTRYPRVLRWPSSVLPVLQLTRPVLA